MCSREKPIPLCSQLVLEMRVCNSWKWRFVTSRGQHELNWNGHWGSATLDLPHVDYCSKGLCIEAMSVFTSCVFNTSFDFDEDIVVWWVSFRLFAAVVYQHPCCGSLYSHFSFVKPRTPPSPIFCAGTLRDSCCFLSASLPLPEISIYKLLPYPSDTHLLFFKHQLFIHFPHADTRS